jgi:hypothetical protein
VSPIPFGGCLRRLLALAVLVALVALAWYYRDDLRSAWQRARGGHEGAEAVVSPELAEIAESKLRTLASAESPARVTLTEAEVQSLLTYRIGGVLPPAVQSPTVALADGRVHLGARVATAAFPSVRGLDEILAFLPDTAEVRARGQLIPVDEERAALEVEEITIARVPVPRRLVPELLERLRPPQTAGGSPTALVFPLPEGASAAFIHGDSLVLLGRGRGRRGG